MKAWMILCCGCGRLLKKDGTTTVRLMHGGALDCDAMDAARDSIASFDTKTEADKAAQSAGWSIQDQYGPNHRCPACDYLPTEVQTRGAYVSTAFLTSAANSRAPQSGSQ